MSRSDTHPSMPDRGPGAHRGLAFRVGAAASVATLAVMLAFALLLHYQMQSAIRSWERREVAALAHHLVAMLDTVPREERVATLERLNEPLAQFGVSSHLTSAGGTPGVGEVRVPLADGPVLEVRATGAGPKLASRLAPLYLGLSAGVVAALLIAVHGSIHWGLTRPLRAVEQQIAQMHRGRWWAPAKSKGVTEIARLGSGLESLGKVLELRVSQWVEAERRAGFELARNRLRMASLELRREIQLHVADLSAGEELSETSRRQLQRASDQLVSQFTRPLEELGLGPPKWNDHPSRLQDDPSS